MEMKNETSTLPLVEDNRYDNSQLISCYGEEEINEQSCIESVLFIGLLPSDISKSVIYQ